jgi:hypothetical protein
MPTLTVSTVVTFGSTTPDGSVPTREPYTYSLTYTQESVKILQFAAAATDVAVALDTVTAPKFLLIQALDTDVTIKLSDGVVATPTPTALAAASGWLMLSNPNGQPIKQFLVTTPASPVTGARVKFIALS